MKKKLLSVLLVAGLVTGVFARCGSNTAQSSTEAGGVSESKKAQARTLEEIKEDGKIKIGVFSDKNPFGYVDENGDIQGYDVYFAKRLAADLLGRCA